MDWIQMSLIKHDIQLYVTLVVRPSIGAYEKICGIQGAMRGVNVHKHIECTLIGREGLAPYLGSIPMFQKCQYICKNQCPGQAL